MARYLALGLLALTLLLSGCMGPGRGPVALPPVNDYEERGRDPEPIATHDCRAVTVDVGTSLIARIRCSTGTGQVEATLQGCDIAQGQSWLSVETDEGHFGTGNATATVTDGTAEIARLRITAGVDDGMETRLDPKADYAMTLDLDGWQGKWVMATVECAAS